MGEKYPIITPRSTLGETVYKMIESGQSGSPEMTILMKYYGCEKLEKLYAEEKERRAAEELAKGKA